MTDSDQSAQALLELGQIIPSEDETALPSIEELLESLRYLNRLCTP